MKQVSVSHLILNFHDGSSEIMLEQFLSFTQKLSNHFSFYFPYLEFPEKWLENFTQNSLNHPNIISKKVVAS